MAFFMDSVSVSADRFARAVVDSGQKPDVSYYSSVAPMKRDADDAVVDPGQKADTVSYYAPPHQVKRVDETVGVEVADPTGTDLCGDSAANDVAVNVQAGVVASVNVAAAPSVVVGPNVVPAQMPKQKLTVGATQLTMEQKITFARLAIAWKGQGRPMREFDTLMKSAGYQVSPSSLAQWMKLPDATGDVPPPRKRKDRDSSKRKFVRQWMPKM